MQSISILGQPYGSCFRQNAQITWTEAIQFASLNQRFGTRKGAQYNETALLHLLYAAEVLNSGLNVCNRVLALCCIVSSNVHRNINTTLGAFVDCFVCRERENKKLLFTVRQHTVQFWTKDESSDKVGRLLLTGVMAAEVAIPSQSTNVTITRKFASVNQSVS